MALVAAVQMSSTNDVQKNIEMACEAIALASKKGAKLVVLPEEFATLGLTHAQKRQVAEMFETGPLQQRLKAAAKQNQIWVIGGTLLIKNEENLPYSSTLVYDNFGNCVGRYDKIHLFDVAVEDNGIYRESENITPGKQVVVIPTPFGRIGIAVCYDIRFPELFRIMMLKGAQIIVLPSAFTIPTGQAHWEVLLRARAIENLCYVIAPGECGVRSDGRGTYGHSMIISYQGEILASLKEIPGVITAHLDLEKMVALRETFPVLDHIQPFVIQALLKEVTQ